MTIQSALAVLDGGSGTEDAMRAAVAIGLAFEAHVECLRIEIPIEPLPISSDGMGGAAVIIDRLEAVNEERTARASAVFTQVCAEADLRVVDSDAAHDGSGATFAWRLVTGHENPEIAQRGRTVDLVVMARSPEDEGGADSAVLEAALFDTGRPVLIAGQGRPPKIAGHVAIAWDGSREAAHSVGLAMPLLVAARSVSAMTVGRAVTTDGAWPISQYLGRHGVACAEITVEASGGSVAEALKEEMAARAVDLAVMGAYGRSAIGEFFFGGATRDMLTTSPLPLFLAH